MPPLPPSSPRGAVRVDLTQQLKDVAAAPKAKAHGATDAAPAAPSAGSHAASLLSLSNAAKALHAVTLLVAFLFVLYCAHAAFLDICMEWGRAYYAEAHPAMMQAAAALAAAATLRPDLVWRSQAAYVALLAAASTYIISLWILFHNIDVIVWLDEVDDAGWDSVSLLAAASLAFFAATAWLNSSPTLAVAAAACFTCMFVSQGYTDAPNLCRAAAGHLAAIAMFITVKPGGIHPRAVYLCTYAIEYYCTAALACILWMGLQVHNPVSAAGFTAAFAAVPAAAALLHYHLGARTPVTVRACAAVLVLCAAVLFGCGLQMDIQWRRLVKAAEPYADYDWILD